LTGIIISATHRSPIMRLAIAALILLSCALPAAELAIPAQGTPAFAITVPAGWSTISGHDGVTVLASPQKHPHIQLWAVAGKRDVDAAAADIAAIITPQVTDFVVTRRSDVTIAGAKAQILVGTGTEADDGDPSNAQATLFTIKGTVWVLISHGEGTGTSERAADIAAIMQTVVAR
jgi:hypothetical protein